MQVQRKTISGKSQLFYLFKKEIRNECNPNIFIGDKKTVESREWLTK